MEANLIKNCSLLVTVLKVFLTLVKKTFNTSYFLFIYKC
jgi:hypothetical protein